MVIVRRLPSWGLILRGAGYGVVIVTLGALSLWAYYKHRAQAGPVTAAPPRAAAAATPAGFDRRRVFALEQELLAPPAFPWSLAALSHLPRAEVRSLRITRFPEETDLPPDLAALLADELTRQARTFARPFTLPSSPPYLVVPLAFEVEFDLDDDGRTAVAAVSGAPGDLNRAFAEAATAFVFPPAAAHVAFAATVTLTPYHYNRLSASRRGRRLSAEDYRLLFRSLQFNSYPVYDAIAAVEPELLSASHETRVTFFIAPDGHPQGVAFEPPLADGAADVIGAALAELYLPAELAGAKVEFLLSN